MFNKVSHWLNQYVQLTLLTALVIAVALPGVVAWATLSAQTVTSADAIPMFFSTGANRWSLFYPSETLTALTPFAYSYPASRDGAKTTEIILDPTNVTSQTNVIYAMDYDESSGLFYIANYIGTRVDNFFYLMTWDGKSPSATKICEMPTQGPIHSSQEYWYYGLAVNSIGTIYVTIEARSTASSSSTYNYGRLATLDDTNGSDPDNACSLSLIGSGNSFGVNERDPRGLDFLYGDLYMTGMTTNHFYSVHTSTAVATSLGAFTTSLYNLTSDGTYLYTLRSDKLYRIPDPTNIGGFTYQIVDDINTTPTFNISGSTSYGLAFASSDIWHFTDISGASACADTSVVVLPDTFIEYGDDFNGNFDVGTCLTTSDADSTNNDNYYGDDNRSPSVLFQFKVGNRRLSSIIFNPNADFEPDAFGQYRVRIRAASFDGDVLTNGEQAGDGSFTLANVDLAGDVPYVAEISRYGIGGSDQFSISVQWTKYIQRSTPTPIPSPTPVPRPNRDVRFNPDPRNKVYAINQVYAFHAEGIATFFPVVVRVGNSDMLKVSSSSKLNCSSTASELTVNAPADTFYFHVCGTGNSVIWLYQKESNVQLALSSVRVTNPLFTVGGGTPTPGPGIPSSVVPPPAPKDPLGLGYFIEEICKLLGRSCQVELVTTTIAFAAAAVAFFLPTLVGKQRSTTFGLGSGLALSIVTLFLGYLMVGLPLWYPVFAVIFLALLTGLGVILKLRRVV